MRDEGGDTCIDGVGDLRWIIRHAQLLDIRHAQPLDIRRQSVDFRSPHTLTIAFHSSDRWPGSAEGAASMIFFFRPLMLKACAGLAARVRFEGGRGGQADTDTDGHTSRCTNNDRHAERNRVLHWNVVFTAKHTDRGTDTRESRPGKRAARRTARTARSPAPRCRPCGHTAAPVRAAWRYSDGWDGR